MLGYQLCNAGYAYRSDPIIHKCSTLSIDIHPNTYTYILYIKLYIFLHVPRVWSELHIYMREFEVDPDHGPSRTKPKTGIMTEIKEKTFVH